MNQYTDGVVNGMQMLYGDGFLSPGGPGEVPELLNDFSPARQRVLDVGCGLGGLAVMLARDYDAAHVTAIDIEPELIGRARTRIDAAGLSDRIEARQVEPGPLPFADEGFDGAIAKDVICHVPDKTAFMAELARVIRPRGRLVIADFFDNRAAEGETATSLFEAYVDGMAVYGLRFHFCPIEDYRNAIEDAGFRLISERDNTAQSAVVARREEAFLASDGNGPIREALGPELFRARCNATEMRHRALTSRGLLHVHLVARKR